MPRCEPQEFELKQDALGPTNANTHHGRRRLEHWERNTFRIGEREKEAVIFDDIGRGGDWWRFHEPGPNVACQEWIRELLRVDRLMSRSKDSSTGTRRHSRIVGFACRRHVEDPFFMTEQERRASRQGALPSLSIIAVCVGGTHCGAMTLPPGSSGGSCGYNAVPAALKTFLCDPRLSFVGHNIERDAARLNSDWGVPLANISELTTLVSRAFRQEWLRGDFGRKGKVKLEDMAYRILDGAVVEEEPQKYRSNYYEYERDIIAYAIRDACLAYDIAEKCEERVRGSCSRRS